MRELLDAPRPLGIGFTLVFASLVLGSACTSVLDDLQARADTTSVGPVTVTSTDSASTDNDDSLVPVPSQTEDGSHTTLPDPTGDTSFVADSTTSDTADTTNDSSVDTTDASDSDENTHTDDGGSDQWDSGTSAPAALQLLDTTPADEAVDVDLTTGLTLEFNQPVRAGQGFIPLALEDLPYALEQLAVSDARVTFVGASVTVDWATEFVPDATYVVTIDAGAIASEIDATFTEQPIVLRFATQPPPPLVLEGTTPVTNSTDVDPNAHFVLMFSEPIALDSGELELWRAGATATLTETFDASSSRLTVSSNTLTIDPTSALSNSRTYYVTLPAGMVVSQQGAAFQGISDATQFQFTTAAAPPDPLLLISSVPTDNALDVSHETTIRLRFSEPIRAGTGAIAVVDAQTMMPFESASVTDARVALSADTATFTLSTPLSMARSYYVTVDAGAFESLAGASFAGISNPQQLNFTVQGSPPECAANEHASAHDGCYFLGTSMVTYAAARNACAARGTGWALAEPRSAQDQSLIQPLLTTDTWIGATDLASEGIWRWESDGTHFWSGDANGAPVNNAYTRWRDIEPTGGTQNCARVMFVTEYAGWYWADSPCDYLYQYLCHGPKG